MADVLVIAADGEAAVRLSAQVDGAQTMGRVVVAPDEPRQVAGADRLRIFTADDRPGAEDVAHLSPAELLFVDAWRARLDEGAKVRPGDGLSWDTTGFQPPDPPYHEDD